MRLPIYGLDHCIHIPVPYNFHVQKDFTPHDSLLWDAFKVLDRGDDFSGELRKVVENVTTSKSLRTRTMMLRDFSEWVQDYDPALSLRIVEFLRQMKRDKI